MQVIIPPKAKADFEQWFVKSYNPNVYRHFEKMGKLMPPEAAAHSTAFGLYHHPFAMQQGVYQEYLREKGIEAESHREFTKQPGYIGRIGFVRDGFLQYNEVAERTDHPEALTAAINAAFERVEETLND